MSHNIDLHQLPVAVIGAGPIGLAAALHLQDRGIAPLVLESGSQPGASILKWHHVRMFSPWKHVVDPLGRSLLETYGWRMPAEDHLPTGGEFVESFLQPLAALPSIGSRIHSNHRVVSIARVGHDKTKTTGREFAPFEIVTRVNGEKESRFWARAVIDASGTYLTPNSLGSGGVHLPGEAMARSQLHYGIPDTNGAHRRRYSGKHVVVVGSGHSAMTVLQDLIALKAEHLTTDITWVLRRADPESVFEGQPDDFLPARGQLGMTLSQYVEKRLVRVEAGFRASELVRSEGLLSLQGLDRTIDSIDEIIVTTGLRPDFDIAREIQLNLHPVLECPFQLAPIIDPSVHSCATVPLHGAPELEHPEPNYFVVGMKSYGRAPSFLMATGYEQVRSVTSAIARKLLANDNSSATDVKVRHRSQLPSCCSVVAPRRSSPAGCDPFAC